LSLAYPIVRAVRVARQRRLTHHQEAGGSR
jgi:hypothetical protein